MASHKTIHYWMAFLMSFFITAGSLCIPLLATHLDASNLELGIIGSAGAAAYAFCTIAGGSLSDKIGRKRVIIMGSLLAGLSFALMPISRTPFHLIMLNVMFGTGSAFYWPVLEAWLTEEGDAEQIRRGLGGFNVSWSAGGALGPLFGGFLYTGSSTVAFLSVAIGIFFVAYLGYLHKPPAILQIDPSDPPATGFKGNGPVVVKRSLLYAAWLANFAGWFAIAEIRVLFPKLALTLGMQPWVIGIQIFVLGVALTAMFYLMGASKWWHTRTSPLVIAQTVFVLLLLITATLDSSVAFAVALFGLGACSGVGYTYSLYFSIVGSQHKGAAGGRHEMVLGTGALLGPLMGGAAAQILHTQRVPYVLAGVLVLASVIGQVYILRSPSLPGKED